MTGAGRQGAAAPARDQQGGRAALLIIDMINCFDFSGADKMRPRALQAAGAIQKLRGHFKAASLPIIYVNDNFGEWHSERSRIIERALEHDNPVSERIKPEDEDFFILKPQFSGFYATNLPVLLPKLGVNRLVLTGIATDICVLFTAADAHMRDYALWVPEDAVAAESDERGKWALEIMSSSMKAEIAPTSDLALGDWLARLDE